MQLAWTSALLTLSGRTDARSWPSCCTSSLQAELARGGRALRRVRGTSSSSTQLWEVEEAFTRTFDVNPACALEVGWHLFGEEYTAAMFLVRMREELRKHGSAGVERTARPHDARAGGDRGDAGRTKRREFVARLRAAGGHKMRRRSTERTPPTGMSSSCA